MRCQDKDGGDVTLGLTYIGEGQLFAILGRRDHPTMIMMMNSWEVTFRRVNWLRQVSVGTGDDSESFTVSEPMLHEAWINRKRG